MRCWPARRHCRTGCAPKLTPRCGVSVLSVEPQQPQPQKCSTGSHKGCASWATMKARTSPLSGASLRGDYERFEEFATEFAAIPVDVIVLGTPAAVRATQTATSTIPIVMGYSTDPVGNGFVASLARPGGNTTGLASLLEEIVAKQVELLRETVPNAQHLGVLTNPGNINSSSAVLASARASSKKLGFNLIPAEARTVEEIGNVFAALRDHGAEALVVSPDAFFHSQARMIGGLALQQRVPSIFSQREYVDHGGLLAYGERLFDFFKRSAVFVDRILKGAAPSDLPIEQPTRFYLTINSRIAKALGLIDPAHAPRPRRRGDRMSNCVGSSGLGLPASAVAHCGL